MKACPNRHPVHDLLEYCDQCGCRVEAPAAKPRPAPDEALMWTCSHCRTSQGLSRYCEACGEPNLHHPDNADHSTDADTQVHVPAQSPPPAPTRMTITAIADRAFFDRMQSHDGPDAANLTFPAVYPPRTFNVDNTQIFIGRRSQSRGIEPDIDLSAAPEDSGVSHAHAAIVKSAGQWNLVDVGSSNGTYVNFSADPIPANTPVALTDGDRVHLGAWTTLTISLGLPYPRP